MMTGGVKALARWCRAEWFAIVSIEPVMYCDESETEGQCLVIAGYAASMEEWERFEENWREALNDEGLDEFHTKPFLSGDEPYQNLCWPERNRIYYRFIGLIREANLLGVSAALDLRGYKALLPRFKRLRAHPTANLLSPYYLAFQTLLQTVVTEVDETTDLEAGERIQFVFDIKKGHIGNSLDIFGELRTTNQRYRDRLAGASFQDSLDYPGLQAADILAYEMRKYAMSVWSEGASAVIRQQLRELRNKGLVRETYLRADSFANLVAEMEWRMEQRDIPDRLTTDDAGT